MVRVVRCQVGGQRGQVSGPWDMMETIVKTRPFKNIIEPQFEGAIINMPSVSNPYNHYRVMKGPLATAAPNLVAKASDWL